MKLPSQPDPLKPCLRARLTALALLIVLAATSGCVTVRRFPAFTGIVRETRTQMPVADATVFASYRTGGLILFGVADGCSTYHTAKTDSKGEFTIPPKTEWAFFFLPIWSTWFGPSEVAVYKDSYEATRADYSAIDELVVPLRRLEDAEDQRAAWRSLGWCPNWRYRPRTTTDGHQPPR